MTDTPGRVARSTQRGHADTSDASDPAIPTPDVTTAAAGDGAVGAVGAPPPGSHRAGSRRRALLLLAIVAAVALGLDVLSKQLVLAHLTLGDDVRLIPGVLDVQLTRNPGAAFGIGTGVTWVFAVVAVLVIAVIARSAARLRSRTWAAALGLLLGGALGNLMDRIFREPGVLQGWVVDWIKFHHFPWNFNIADSCITIGGVMAVLLAMRGTDLSGRPPDAGGDVPAPGQDVEPAVAERDAGRGGYSSGE